MSGLFALHESVCEMLSPRGTSALDRGQSAKSPARQFRKVCYYYIDPFSLMQILRIHSFKFSSKIDAASISQFLRLVSSAVKRRTIEGRRPGGVRSPQSGDGARLHSLGDSSAGRGVPPREVGTARRVCGATSPRRRAKGRRRRARGRTEGRDAVRHGWSAARRGNSTRSALAPPLPKSFKHHPEERPCRSCLSTSVLL